MDDYNNGGETGIIVLSLLFWVVLCSLSAFLFKIKSKIFKEDKKVTDIKFEAVWKSCMAGAIYGVGLLILILPITLFLLSLLPDNRIFNEAFGWISTPTGWLVIYFSCVFVCGVRWLLSQERIQLDLDKEWKI